ncbi:CpsD/CapB family tyrosine-protein kinase [Paenibacillus hexagrammi]|uniref:non-specific protein-tyrosine kinase n=1 Tax=Paenibacillus hexagrammi TaxID=2908839 RepID=A0ABY3SFI9_9BACL|nr:CpsD/CapB family tyrosine-protein kinase [Paenibacillus sp. YPD9-1]UJF32783.1 polysaccharide biosynthesis tyrosine autokinase [Paenibacillus sp. YPD9-1]
MGIVFSLGLILSIRLLDTRIRTEEDLFTVCDSFILGTIQSFKKVKKGIILITKMDHASAIAETFRTIRTSMHYLRQDEDQKLFLICSAAPGEGKTTVVSNLSIITALDGKRVLLIDGDLRNPHLHHVFEIPNRVGLSSILTGHSTLGNAVRETQIPGLFILPAGPLQPHPAELFGTMRMDELCQNLKTQFDCVFIDSPSLLSVTDARIIKKNMDGIIITIRLNSTKKDHIKKNLTTAGYFKKQNFRHYCK